MGLAVVVGALAFGADILGEVFFVGLLDRLVGEASHGWSAETVPTILRTLPYGRLILADVILTVLVVLGSLALIVPGVVLFTLLCLSGPIVNIEGRSAASALWRSAQLVRRRFWMPALLVAVPFSVADWVASAIQDAVHGESLVIDFVLHAALATIIATVTGP